MKGIKITVLITFLVIFAVQASQVLAHNKDDDQPITGPVTSPITSPITSPNCKPGWGFGDKNHCHSGPPGKHHDFDIFGKDFDKFEKDFGKSLSDAIQNCVKGFHILFHFDS